MAYTILQPIDSTGISEDGKTRAGRIFDTLIRQQSFQDFLAGTGQFQQGDRMYPIWQTEPAMAVVDWLRRQDPNVVAVVIKDGSNPFVKNEIAVMMCRLSDTKGNPPRAEESIVDYIRRIKA